jgi:hypothetical protein
MTRLEKLREVWKQSLSLPPSPCIGSCVDGKVWCDGVRWRTATLWLEGGAEFVADIPARRFRCSCGERWFVAAEGVPERAHYQPCVVAQAVAADACSEESSVAVARRIGCHLRTLWRMVDRVAQLLGGGLAGELLKASGEPMLPGRPALRARQSERRATAAERSMAALGLLEALASQRGLAPPGLAHVGRFIPEIAGRVRREVAASMPA